jgi:branched-chain amino acid transport system substrate-binding protein
MLTRIAVSLMCVVFIAGLGAGAAYAQAKEVVIGVPYPMSGAIGQAGVDGKVAFELARDIANGDVDVPFPLYQRIKGMPNLGGAKVRLVIADHQGKPELGQSVTERLITQEKVHALLGALQSGVTATASFVAERHGVPFITAASSSPELTRRGFKWFFRNGPHEEHYTQAIFDFLRDFEKKRGVKLKTIGLTYEDSLFGHDSGKTSKAMAAKYGYDVVVDTTYRAQSASLAVEVQKLKAANPDVWIPTSYTTDAILFVKTAKELNYNPKMIVAQGTGHIAPEFVQGVGALAEGTMSRAPYNLDIVEKRPVAKLIADMYQKRAGKELYQQPAIAFAGMITLLDAINRAGSTAPDAIRKALIATNIPGDQLILAWDGVRFDDTGQNTGVRAIIIQLQGGKYHTVYPFESATREIIYPIGK